jgi:hypothetical protein
MSGSSVWRLVTAPSSQFILYVRTANPQRKKYTTLDESGLYRNSLAIHPYKGHFLFPPSRVNVRRALASTLIVWRIEPNG